MKKSGEDVVVTRTHLFFVIEHGMSLLRGIVNEWTENRGMKNENQS